LIDVEPMCRTLAIAVLLAVAGMPFAVLAQHERDYINTDEEGHLIFRYAGSQSPWPTEEQMEEITNAFNSVMVHDLLRADLIFDTELRDEAWAEPMERAIEGHLATAALQASEIDAECQSKSCRLWVIQSGAWTVEDHQIAMDQVQDELQELMRAHAGRFEPVFLITAYYQESEPHPYLKVFLYRADAAP
jgi:hypothetical protein